MIKILQKYCKIVRSILGFRSKYCLRAKQLKNPHFALVCHLSPWFPTTYMAAIPKCWVPKCSYHSWEQARKRQNRIAITFVVAGARYLQPSCSAREPKIAPQENDHCGVKTHRILKILVPIIIYVPWAISGCIDILSSSSPSVPTSLGKMGQFQLFSETSTSVRLQKTDSNGEIFYIDLLILCQYTLFFGEEPQIPKNVQKVDTLVDTLYIF